MISLQTSGPIALTPSLIASLQNSDPLMQTVARAALPQIALLTGAGQQISESLFANSDFFGAKGFQNNVTPAALGFASLAQGAPLDQLVSGNPIPRFASPNSILGATMATFDAINNTQFGTGFNVAFTTSSAFPFVPAGPQSNQNLNALQALALPTLAPINQTNPTGLVTAIPFSVPQGLPASFTVLRADPNPVSFVNAGLGSIGTFNQFNPPLGFVPVTPFGVNGPQAPIARGLLPGQVPLQGGQMVNVANPFIPGATGGIQVPLSNLVPQGTLNVQANTPVTFFPLGGVPQVNPFPYGVNPTATTVLASTTNFIDQLLFRPATFVPGQGAFVVANPYGGITLLDPNDPMSAGTSLFYPTGFNPVLATGVPLSSNFDPNFGVVG